MRLERSLKILEWAWVALWFVMVGMGALVMMGNGCRSHVPVIVNAQHYQCEVKHESGNGSIQFQDCIKTDGTGPVQDNASDSSGEGPTGYLPKPQDWRLN